MSAGTYSAMDHVHLGGNWACSLHPWFVKVLEAVLSTTCTSCRLELNHVLHDAQPVVWKCLHYDSSSVHKASGHSSAIYGIKSQDARTSSMSATSENTKSTSKDPDPALSEDNIIAAGKELDEEQESNMVIHGKAVSIWSFQERKSIRLKVLSVLHDFMSYPHDQEGRLVLIYIKCNSDDCSVLKYRLSMKAENARFLGFVHKFSPWTRIPSRVGSLRRILKLRHYAYCSVSRVSPQSAPGEPRVDCGDTQEAEEYALAGYACCTLEIRNSAG